MDCEAVVRWMVRPFVGTATTGVVAENVVVALLNVVAPAKVCEVLASVASVPVMAGSVCVTLAASVAVVMVAA